MTERENHRENELLRQQDVLARFGEFALRSDDLDEILHEACHLVGEALETDLAKVMELQPDGITLLVRSGVGWKPGVVGQVTVRAEKGSSEGHALQMGKPVASHDIDAEDRFTYADFLKDNGVRALVNVIIIGPEGAPPYGILEVDSRKPRAFTDGDTNFLRGYANLLAGAVARLRLLDEARKREEALRHSEAHFRAAVDLNPQIPWTADPRGKVDGLDARWAQTSGLTVEESVGDGWMQAPHPDDLPGMAAAWAEAVSTGGTYDVEVRLRSSQGGYRWTRVQAYPLRNAEGEVLRWYGTTDDVEDRRRLEAALREANETLEERVADRTRALEREQQEREETEERLRQSQKMEAVGQLTGGLAHDFNNLLTGIVGSLDLIQKRVAQGRTENLERYVTLAMTSANRAAALTHRLLAFSRRQTLDPKVVETNGLVAGLEEMLRRTVGPSIAVESTLPAGVGTILCDPNQLENAVLNLAINARDAMPDGGTLRIETANVDVDEVFASRRDMPEGDYVTVSVSDTGTGMPPDVVARAFDPFFTTKPLGEGTGLGLSMIYGFAKQSGGQVRIHSQADVGTSVTIYLPRHRGEVAPMKPMETNSVVRAEAGETVLVVDDEPAIRTLIGDVLQDLGYASVEAVDGRSGLRQVERPQRIDLLVTDVGLPGGMNGRQLADAARVLRPGLKVLFITGFAETAAVGGNALEIGMAIMTKPFTMEALTLRIRTMLHERGET